MPRPRQEEPDPNETAREAALSRAWSAYCEATRDLTGDAYQEAELVSWERLQRELAEISDVRA